MRAHSQHNHLIWVPLWSLVTFSSDFAFSKQLLEKCKYVKQCNSLSPLLTLQMAVMTVHLVQTGFFRVSKFKGSEAVNFAWKVIWVSTRSWRKWSFQEEHWTVTSVLISVCHIRLGRLSQSPLFPGTFLIWWRLNHFAPHKAEMNCWVTLPSVGDFKTWVLLQHVLHVLRTPLALSYDSSETLRFP